MNAPLVAHSPFGGSVATRVLHCPAAAGLVEKVPAHLRRTSSYAERGTALHTAMTLLLGNEISLKNLIGKTIGNYTITCDDVEIALRPVLAYVDALLLDAPGAEYFIERRVAFPTVEGAFGTCDLLVRVGNTAHVVDHKFGSGVRVLAVYPDGDEDVVNAQLMFYATAARYTVPEFFAGVQHLVLTILQPQSIEPDAELVSSVTVSHAELDAFVEIYRAACAEALSPTPRLERGAWCKFCPARPICPAHTAPLLDLAQFEAPKPLAFGGVFTGSPDREAYLRALAAGLDLVDAVKDIGVALRDQAKHALEVGDVVPGYALSAGRAERHWHDESAAIAALTDLGLARDDIVAETMRSPAQVERRAKARGLKIPSELIGSHRSGVSLVKSENVRIPVRGRDEIVRTFAAALEVFQQGGTTDE